jgi:hypothetical protein
VSIFGTIVSDDQVEEAVIVTLQKWIPTYLSEVERQRGIDAGYYRRPESGSYYARTDFDKWPEEMLPAIIVIAPGIEDDPSKAGDGVYRGLFPIAVTCVVSSTNQIETRRYAQRLGAAIRAALVQHQSLGNALDDEVRGVDWIGARNNELPPEGDRSIWANRQLFAVEVGDVVTKSAGPRNADPIVPSTAPYPDPPTVIPNATEITLKKVQNLT